MDTRPEIKSTEGTGFDSGRMNSDDRSDRSALSTPEATIDTGGLIERDAPRDEHENRLAVTQILAGLRYNDPRLFQVLGGREPTIESPLLQEFGAE